MSSKYAILIPNSEGKEIGGEESLTYRFVSNLKKYNEFITLQTQRETIIDEMRRILTQCSQEELEKFFDLKGENLKQAVSSISTIRDEVCMPAISRMNGVMYKSIDYESFDSKIRERFNANVYIIDGLFGILKPLDLIPNYKCKVSMRIFNSTLSTFWAKELKGFLSYTFKDTLVIDLLPKSHREIINSDEHITRIRISFAKKENNSYKLEGHLSKALKGEFIAFVLSHQTITKEILKQFKHSLGFAYSEQFSTPDEFIYIK